MATILYSAIPAPLPDGFAIYVAQQGGYISNAPDGWEVSGAVAVQGLYNTYAGSAAQLSVNKSLKQAALDALFDANFDLTKFIRGGTVTTITATNVGNFLSQITNNYRSLRAQIAAAASVAAVNAININSGWPSNP